MKENEENPSKLASPEKTARDDVLGRQWWLWFLAAKVIGARGQLRLGAGCSDPLGILLGGKGS